MKFGIQHASGDPNWGPGILAPAAVAGFARAAEESGYAAIAFTDHPAPSTKWIESGGEGVADPFSALGFCAAVTTSIRLLTYVLVPPYRNPFVAAQQVATLDVLSAGRVTLGLGTGYLRGEFRAVGADLERRRSTFDEHLAVMREAWAGQEITRDGSSFSAPGTQVFPRPEQQPHPPLWIHGNGPWARQRAARGSRAASSCSPVLSWCVRSARSPSVISTRSRTASTISARSWRRTDARSTTSTSS